MFFNEFFIFPAHKIVSRNLSYSLYNISPTSRNYFTSNSHIASSISVRNVLSKFLIYTNDRLLNSILLRNKKEKEKKWKGEKNQFSNTISYSPRFSNLLQFEENSSWNRVNPCLIFLRKSKKIVQGERKKRKQKEVRAGWFDYTVQMKFVI